MDTYSLSTTLLSLSQKQGVIETIANIKTDNVKTMLCFSQQALESSIDVLQLSVRSHNGLCKAKITTIDHLTKALEENTLVRIRNLGKKSLSEIKTKVLVFSYEHLHPSSQLAFWQHFVENNLTDNP